MIASWSMSMAESTACSASSEYGGRRSRYGSRAACWAGTIENSTGELDIFPGGALPGWVPEKRSGVVRHDERHPVITVDLPPELIDRELRGKKSLGRELPKRNDHI